MKKLTLIGLLLYTSIANEQQAPKHTLLALTEDLFAVNNADDFRIWFEHNKDGIAEKKFVR